MVSRSCITAVLAMLLFTLPQPAEAGSPFAVVGPPTISAAQLDRVLCARKSPTCGMGGVFWQEAVAAGVDPAVWLATFVLESNVATDGGLSAAIRNPGNTRCGTSWRGRCVSGYRAFAEWQRGARDTATVLKLYRGHDVYSMQAIYAPAGDCVGEGKKRVCNNPAQRGQAAAALIRQWWAEETR